MCDFSQPRREIAFRSAMTPDLACADGGSRNESRTAALHGMAAPAEGSESERVSASRPKERGVRPASRPRRGASGGGYGHLRSGRFSVRGPLHVPRAWLTYGFWAGPIPL